MPRGREGSKSLKNVCTFFMDGQEIGKEPFTKRKWWSFQMHLTINGRLFAYVCFGFFHFCLILVGKEYWNSYTGCLISNCDKYISSERMKDKSKIWFSILLHSSNEIRALLTFRLGTIYGGLNLFIAIYRLLRVNKSWNRNTLRLCTNTS